MAVELSSILLRVQDIHNPPPEVQLAWATPDFFEQIHPHRSPEEMRHIIHLWIRLDPQDDPWNYWTQWIPKHWKQDPQHHDLLSDCFEHYVSFLGNHKFPFSLTPILRHLQQPWTPPKYIWNATIWICKTFAVSSGHMPHLLHRCLELFDSHHTFQMKAESKWLWRYWRMLPDGEEARRSHVDPLLCWKCIKFNSSYYSASALTSMLFFFPEVMSPLHPEIRIWSASLKRPTYADTYLQEALNNHLQGKWAWIHNPFTTMPAGTSATSSQLDERHVQDIGAATQSFGSSLVPQVSYALYREASLPWLHYIAQRIQLIETELSSTSKLIQQESIIRLLGTLTELSMQGLGNDDMCWFVVYLFYTTPSFRILERWTLDLTDRMYPPTPETVEHLLDIWSSLLYVSDLFDFERSWRVVRSLMEAYRQHLVRHHGGNYVRLFHLIRAWTMMLGRTTTIDEKTVWCTHLGQQIIQFLTVLYGSLHVADLPDELHLEYILTAGSFLCFLDRSSKPVTHPTAIVDLVFERIRNPLYWTSRLDCARVFAIALAAGTTAETTSEHLQPAIDTFFECLPTAFRLPSTQTTILNNNPHHLLTIGFTLLSYQLKTKPTFPDHQIKCLLAEVGDPSYKLWPHLLSLLFHIAQMTVREEPQMAKICVADWLPDLFNALEKHCIRPHLIKMVIMALWFLIPKWARILNMEQVFPRRWVSPHASPTDQIRFVVERIFEPFRVEHFARQASSSQKKKKEKGPPPIAVAGAVAVAVAEEESKETLEETFDTMTDFQGFPTDLANQFIIHQGRPDVQETLLQQVPPKWKAFFKGF